MQSNVRNFLYRLTQDFNDDVLAIIEFGSRKGEDELSLSDIDLLVVTKNSTNLTLLTDRIYNLEKNVLGEHHSKFNRWLQACFFVSTDYAGIHVMTIKQDELSATWQPISWRTRFLINLIGPRAFYQGIIDHHLVLYGEDPCADITVPSQTFRDSIAPYIYPLVILLVAPFSKSRSTFIIWCAKALKYSVKPIDIVTYRYRPTEYSGSLVYLWLRAFKSVFVA